MVTLAATDPANLYGSVLRWPAGEEEEGPRMLTRSVGASVILRNGELMAYLRRGNPGLQIFLPAEEPDHSITARDLSQFLATLAQQDMERREDQRGGMLISNINGQPAAQHFLASFLQDAGFHLAPQGLKLQACIASRRYSQCLKAIPSFARPALCTRRLPAKPSNLFETAYAPLASVNDQNPVAGRTVEQVESRGKWLLMHFSGDLILTTHMLMSGSWHILSSGERWKRARSHMRIVLGTLIW